MSQALPDEWRGTPKRPVLPGDSRVETHEIEGGVAVGIDGDRYVFSRNCVLDLDECR